MPLAKIQKCILHFVHIPKTGGSSVNSYLRAKGALALYSRLPVDCMSASPQHLHRTAFRSIIPDAFCDGAFTILRDPVDRLVSEYRYRAARQSKSDRSNAKNSVEWHDGSAFDGGFDAWVATALRDAAIDPWLYDNHFRPQVEFWHAGLTTFLFEDGLQQVFDWIDDVTGTARPLPEVHENPGAPIEVDMTPGTEKLIRRFYRADDLLIRQIKKAGTKRFSNEQGPRIALGATRGPIVSAK